MYILIWLDWFFFFKVFWLFLNVGVIFYPLSVKASISNVLDELLNPVFILASEKSIMFISNKKSYNIIIDLSSILVIKFIVN